MAGVVEFNGVLLFPQAVAIPATPGDISIQNILGVLKQVNDQGVASAIGGGGGGVTSVAGLTGVVGAQALDNALVQEYYAKLAANGNLLELPGLNGDVDGDYLVTGAILSNSSSSNSFGFLFNGAATNLKCVSSNIFVGAVASNDWNIGQLSQSPATWASGDYYEFSYHLRARSGQIRTMMGLAKALKGGTAVAFNFMGECTDTATNLTKLSITSTNATGLTAGTWIRCLRVQSTNPLA